jgi:flagellar protein FliO/FliZ
VKSTLVLGVLCLWPGVSRAQDAGLNEASASERNLGALVAQGLAQERAAEEPEIPSGIPAEFEGEMNLGWTLLRTLLVLGIVVGLAWLTLNVGLRKLLGIRPVVGTRLVTVLDRVALDQKRSLFVVQVADEYLLLGGSDQSLALISKLDSKAVAPLKASAPAPVQLSPLLKKLLAKKELPSSLTTLANPNTADPTDAEARQNTSGNPL